jgi:hypothetical protein
MAVFGIVGAAVAWTIRPLLLLAFRLPCFCATFPAGWFWGPPARVLAAAAVMGASLWLLAAAGQARVPPLVLVAWQLVVSLGIYGAAILAFRVVRVADVRRELMPGFLAGLD